jgi:uncharacterized protein (TIGR02217 family)
VSNFHDIRFPVSVGFASSGGPERRTDIVTLASGAEERNTPWQHARRRYDAGLGIRSLDQLQEVIAFFEARRGQLYGFRWKDFTDFTSGAPAAAPTKTDQPLGTGDGLTTAFFITKTYEAGAYAYVRPITKPVLGTLLVAVDGVLQQENTDFTVDYALGQITFINGTPANSAIITAGFEFDVPVRFDTALLNITLDSFNADAVPSIPIIEVRL